MQLVIFYYFLFLKGYNQNTITGDIDFSDNLIKLDLKDINNPNTTVGFLVSTFLSRKKNKSGPITILNCDNVLQNGNMTKKLCLQFAEQIDKELVTWIKVFFF